MHSLVLVSVRAFPPGTDNDLARCCEELERDAVRVTEAHSRAVGRVLDAAVLDTELGETTRPLLELGSVGASEREMVEADPVLAEPLVRCRGLVLVQPDQGAVAEEIDGVVEVWIRVLVDHGLGIEQRFVPRHAH